MKRLLLVVMFTLSAIYSGSRGIEQPVYLAEVVLTYQTEEQQVYNTVIDMGYTPFVAKLLVAQARHESGNFKSRLYRKHQNAFGMMYSKRRPTVALNGSARAEGHKGFADYNNLSESTEDVVMFLKHRGCKFDFKTVGEYVSWLKKIGYFTDNKVRYQNAISIHLKKINQNNLV